MLSREGYEVIRVRDGFEALACLRLGEPNILISELAMPNMSGFELLAVVRKRFPAIGVIAVSDEFAPVVVPDGVLADRFLRKGKNLSFELLETVRELLSESPVRPQPARTEAAPAWLPRSASGYVVVTCPTCLRSFSVPARPAELGVLLKDICIHCSGDICYRIDSTVATTAQLPSLAARVQQLRAASADLIHESRDQIQDSKRLRSKKR